MSKRRTESPISDVLRKTIAESGIPYLVLERETGVVRTSIMRFVQGETSLVLDKADKLAAHFGLELSRKRTRVSDRLVKKGGGK